MAGNHCRAGRDNGPVVVQRFSHTHEDDVRDLTRPFKLTIGMEQLLLNFRGAEVFALTQCPGRAKCAAHLTPNLTRYAQCCPLVVPEHDGLYIVAAVRNSDQSQVREK